MGAGPVVTIEFMLLVLFGAFVGSAVSSYHCGKSRTSLTTWGHNVDLIVCILIGAGIGALLYFGFIRFL